MRRAVQAVREVDWVVQLRNNPALQSLDGLQGLQRVGNEIFVKANGNLTSLAALANLKAIGGQGGSCWAGLGWIFGPRSLACSQPSRPPPKAVSSVQKGPHADHGSPVKVRDSKLPLPSLTGIKGSYCSTWRYPAPCIRTNLVPTSTAVPDCFWVSPPHLLLPARPPRPAGGSLDLFYNPSLASLDGLQGLTAVPADLAVVGCGPALTDLGGLAGVKAVGLNLVLGSNAGLRDLTGLGEHSTAWHGVHAQHSTGLRDLTGLGEHGTSAQHGA